MVARLLFLAASVAALIWMVLSWPDDPGWPWTLFYAVVLAVSTFAALLVAAKVVK